LYLRVVNDADIIKLQSALDTLSDWAATWQLTISVEKCCILNIGSITVAPLLSINHTHLPVLSSNRDLGVITAHDLSPSTHICGIVAKAHHRANAVHRAFVSRDVSLLLRAYLVYVRPLIESNSVVWSPCLKQDIDARERVQRRFTKRLPGFNNSTFAERLSRLNLPTLELRRLHSDLTWCYKSTRSCLAV